ncbi:MAG TPA: beta-mannosidase [Bacteroidales bacterium]|nr:beta-mannosidase [Bacteroidales bacterium]
MNRVTLFLSIVLVLFSGCSSKNTNPDQDKKQPLSKESIAILQKLGSLGNRFLIAHQDATSYGVTWNYSDTSPKCDIRDVCGDYPAAYGFDLGHIELDHTCNLDSVDFTLMNKLIREAHARGGLITISWHLDNPVSGGQAWDTTHAVSQILPGGAFYDKYVTWVDKVATFLKGLKDEKQVPIPVFFRPFHEMSGGWFWWGAGHCTPDQYKELWKQTVRLLRNKHELDNLIFVYNTDKVENKERYLIWYPGDEWVDVIGLDFYDRSGTLEGFTDPLKASLSMLKEVGQEHHKIYALTEAGYETIPDPGWWTGRLLPALQKSGIAWVLLWRNDRPSHHYAPYPGHPSSPDFIKFFESPETVFGREWAALNQK